MLTPTAKELSYRATRRLNREELARQLGIRMSTFNIYEDVLLRNSENSLEHSLSKCRNCLGTGYEPFQNLIKVANTIRIQRPEANIGIDQCSLSDTDLARRVHILLESHDPTATSFAFIGDDDLASLLLLKVSVPRKVLVIDIDHRILDTIKTNTPFSQKTKLHLLQMDIACLASEIGNLKEDVENYDVAITDPPYADVGMITFIYTASILLRLGGRLYIAVPHVIAESWTDDLMQLVQSELLNLGFVINKLIPGFFAYNESDVLSSLIVATKRNNIDVSDLLKKYDTLNFHRFYTTRQAV